MKKPTVLVAVALLALAVAGPAAADNGKKDKGRSAVAATEGDGACGTRKEDNLIEDGSDFLVWITLTPHVSLDDLVWSIFNNGTSSMPVATGDQFYNECDTGTHYLVSLSDLDTSQLGTKKNGRPESYTVVIDLESGENYGADSFRWAD